MNINNDNTLDTYYSKWYGSSLINNEYKNEHNNSCNLPTLIFIRNHKTGGYMKNWERKLQTHCNLHRSHLSIIDYNLFECDITSNISLQENENELDKCYHQMNPELNDIPYMEKKKAPMYMKRYWNYKPSKKKSEIMKISEKSNVHLIIISKLLDINSENQSYIPIMSVRTPLETILSGYNYHAQGSETKWTDANLTHVQYNRGSVPLLYCFQNVFSDQNEYIINHKSTMYKEYKKGYMNNYSNISALKYGLYLEFTRYVNCEWPLIISMYNELKYNNKYKWFLFLRFEWFHNYNYTKSIYYFINQLGIKNNKNNYDLITDLLHGDLDYIVKNNNQTVMHVTRNRYDKQSQIKLLLTYNKNVCNKIKKMTLMLDDIWYHQQYC